MDFPEDQAHALLARVSRELPDLISREIEATWTKLDTPHRSAVERFFNVGFDVTHRLQVRGPLEGGRTLTLDLFVNAGSKVPAVLEIEATSSWRPAEPAAFSVSDRRFEGAPDDVDRLNADADLCRLVRRAIRDAWSSGNMIVQRPDAGLEIARVVGSGAALFRLSTMPRAAWLGWVQDFGLRHFLDVVRRVERLHGIG
jgi:hypothetical protein